MQPAVRYRFDVNWLMKKEHKNLSKVEADGSVSEEEKAVLRGIHKRHLSCADGPSEKDLDFLQENYGMSHALTIKALSTKLRF